MLAWIVQHQLHNQKVNDNFIKIIYPIEMVNMIMVEYLDGSHSTGTDIETNSFSTAIMRSASY